MVVEEELTGGVELDAAGAALTGVAADPAEGVPVAEPLLLAALGVAATTDVEDGARGVAAGAVDAGLGAGGAVGPLATVTGAA